MAFLLDSGLSGPATGVQVADAAVSASASDAAVRDDAAARQKLTDQFGVSVRSNAGRYEYFFRADGKDQVVHTSAATTDGLEEAQERLATLTEDRMTAISQRFNVTFNTPGETVEPSLAFTSDCQLKPGEMIYAKEPTLPQLYAVQEGLLRSEPSHLSADGKTGLKIYFLDKQIIPSPYGGKPALGVYRDEDKDRRPALFITPDGGSLPVTAADTTMPQQRDLKSVIIHEIGHNSQHNLWGDGPMPDALAAEFGWHQITVGSGKDKRGVAFLNAKDGGYYWHGRVAGCSEPTAWVKLNEKHTPIDANGKEVGLLSDAVRLTNEQVQAGAVVRPVTYYFPSPKEMLTEAITTFRESSTARARMLHESPQLYAVAKKYDEEELVRAYGVDPSGKPNRVRTPEGLVVPRTDAIEQVVRAYETTTR